MLLRTITCSSATVLFFAQCFPLFACNLQQHFQGPAQRAKVTALIPLVSRLLSFCRSARHCEQQASKKKARGTSVIGYEIQRDSSKNALCTMLGKLHRTRFGINGY